MKKLLMAAMALFVATVTVCAGPPKDNDATAWKYAKKQAKEYRKEGWKIDGMFTMEESFYKLRQEYMQDPENNYPMTGRTDDLKNKEEATTITGAKNHAYNAAAILYAKQASLSLRGVVTAEIGGGLGTSMDNFYEAYEGLVAKYIQGELKIRLGLYKETPKNTIDYLAFFIINEEKASKARLRAMEEALTESEFAREHAEEISNFVREKFKPEAE